MDRIDSRKEYTKGNVRVISSRANQLKSDSTPIEAILLGVDARKRLAVPR